MITLVLKRLARPCGRGQLIPVVALALTVLMGAAALAVDVGYWRYQQRIEQSAADSAAIAGAAEISFPAANDVARSAQSDATANGFTDGVANAAVQVDWPPTSGPNQNLNSVEVIITKKQPTFFAGIFGGNQTVRARAVAVLSPAHSGCIYVLKGGISGDLTLHGGGRGGITTNPLCGLVVNGDMTVTGQANVDVSYAAYAGNGPMGGTYPHGQPVKGVAGTDPCPRLPGCAYLQTLRTTHPELFSGPCQDAGGVLPGSPPGTSMPPGRYCTAISANVTLAPGLFVFDQGPPTGTLGGTNVTVYNNCTPSGNTNCNFTLSGGKVNETIIAPLTGPTAGMAYYQAPGLANTFTFNGASGTVTAIGAVYAPGSSFTFNGQLPTISFLSVGQIIMNGGGLNAGSGAGYPLPGNAVLAE